MGRNGTKAGRLSTGIDGVLHLVFHASVGSGGPFNSLKSPRRKRTTHEVNRRNVMLLRGGGGMLPIGLSGIGGVTIVNRGTVGVVAMKNNDSSLGAGCRMSPLTNLGGHVNLRTRVICTHKCMNSPADRCDNIGAKRGLGSSHSTSRLLTRTLGITGSTSCIVFFNKLGGDGRRSYRSSSHSTLNLPCTRSEMVDSLTGMGGGLVFIGVSNGTITVP